MSDTYLQIPRLAQSVSNPTSTIQERFEAFHRANPSVLKVIISIARELRNAGMSKFGISLVYERIRWLYAIQTHGDDYKVNNDFRAFYARVAMCLCEDLDGVFDIRAQTNQYIPNFAALNIDPSDPSWQLP